MSVHDFNLEQISHKLSM